MRLMVSIVLFLLSMCGILAKPTVEESFAKFMIVPTFLRYAPQSALSVRYNNIVVDMGNEIDGFVTHLPPYITYEANSTDLYTLLFVDLDRPSGLAPFESPYLHLLVMNIPGANVTDGAFLTVYLPPLPYPGSGYHRFLFLVYRQVSSIDCDSPQLTSVRNDPRNFSLIGFASEYDMGNPIAGNFFTSRLSVCGYRRNYATKKCI